ncbi:Os07g0627200 [Oryza sativa Japonica Group]|nr:Os07g0627200 [Oryza sativa Japonica Group]
MDSAILRHLIEALLERQPILGEDSTFLRRALVFGGVASIISPVHLESFFTRYGVVIATVLLRDATRCERVGMLVFSAESDCLYAAEMEAARPGAYLMISRVDDEILHNSVNLVKDAADQQSQRCSTAEAFRRMVPWRYLKADAQEDINLRCLLLRMGARSTATPGDLYGVASHSCLPTQQACVTNDFTTPVFSVLPPHSSCDGAVFKRTSPLLDPTAMASWRLPTRKGVLPVTGDRYLGFYPIRGQPLGRAILISYQVNRTVKLAERQSSHDGRERFRVAYSGRANMKHRR